jgi:hypothetical protein
VQGGALLLRRRPVDSLLDQDVAEAEAGPDEPALDEGVQVTSRGTGDLRFEQRGDLALLELLADDRGPLERGALAGAEAVEADREQRL